MFDFDEPLLKLNTNGSEAAVTTFGVNGITTRHTGNSYFYTWDPQGSPVQKFTGTNTLTYTRMYDAFGQAYYSDTNSDSYNSFGAQWGYWEDSGTGLCQLGHRFYDPSTGRFLTRDPNEYSGGINLYEALNNQPTIYADPNGTGSVLPPVITNGIACALAVLSAVANCHHPGPACNTAIAAAVAACGQLPWPNRTPPPPPQNKPSPSCNNDDDDDNNDANKVFGNENDGGETPGGEEPGGELPDGFDPVI